MRDVILTDKILSSSDFSHVIDGPIDGIDIAEWLFNLSEDEFERCCFPDHISCGTGFTDNGTRLLINVEMIGRTLTIHHYVPEIATPHHCRMVSTSDALTSSGRTRVQVIWTLSVKPVDGGQCEYAQSVVIHPTQAYLAFIAQQGLNFFHAARASQDDAEDHYRRETPLIAESIARRAHALHGARAAGS